MSFEAWLREVDKILVRKIGLTHSDLSDFNSRDMFEDGCTPADAASECLANDDTFSAFSL